MANLIITTEKDISQIGLGDSYIVDGPADPIEFFDFLQKIEPLIEKHIQSLFEKDNEEIDTPSLNEDRRQQLKDDLTVVEMKALLKEAGISGYSRLREDRQQTAVRSASVGKCISLHKFEP